MNGAVRYPCFEFVAWEARNPPASDLLSEPGAVRRDAAGRAEVLHIAPRRWLVPAPSSALRARFEQLESAGIGSLIDVEGKWQAVPLSGEHARAILESSIDIDFVLRDRGCGALLLFDCPAIVAHDGLRFEVWVASSYAQSFSSTVGALSLRDSSSAAS